MEDPEVRAAVKPREQWTAEDHEAVAQMCDTRDEFERGLPMPFPVALLLAVVAGLDLGLAVYAIWSLVSAA